jgi:hypothetical protein
MGRVKLSVRPGLVKTWSLTVAALLCILLTLPSPVRAQGSSFTISARSENEQQGTISPSGLVSVPSGASQTFAVTPKQGYRVSFLQVDGKSQGAIDTFTFANVSANHTITAGFSAMTFTIDATSGPNGSLLPNSLLRYQLGDSQTFTITPNAGYKTEDVVVDGVPKGVLDSYTFAGIDRSHTISVTFVPTSTSTGGNTTAVEPGFVDLKGALSGEGVFLKNVTANSTDGKVSLSVNRGTSYKLGTGQVLSQIGVVGSGELPPPPGSTVFGSAYALLPESAYFDLAVTLRFSYDAALLPAGVSEEELAIATWEPRTRVWENLRGVVLDKATQSISASLNRFAPCAIIVPRKTGAVIIVKDLEITPKEVFLGGSATVRVTVSNNGDVAGEYPVALLVNGSPSDTKAVRLSPGATQTIEFALTATAAGSLAINIDSLAGALTVTAPPPAPSPEPAKSSGLPIILAAVLGGLVLLGGVVLLLVRRRRPAPVMRSAASFTLKDLAISPKQLPVGSKAAVAVTVNNQGGHAGTFRVVLRVDGLASSMKEVTLLGGTSERVELSVPGTAVGSFTVDVGGLTDTLTVTDSPSIAGPKQSGHLNSARTTAPP